MNGLFPTLRDFFFDFTNLFFSFIILVDHRLNLAFLPEAGVVFKIVVFEYIVQYFLRNYGICNSCI